MTLTFRPPSHRLRIGIDLGGTKIAGVAIDENEKVVKEVRTASPRDDYKATLTAITTVIDQLHGGQCDDFSVGIGMPGSIAPNTNGVQNANSTWLNDRPLGADLSQALAREVRLANDANCFALSEATDGAARDTSSVFGVILGTGVGGGIVLDGRVWHGADGVAGEWGHNPLPWAEPSEMPGEACYCGRRGCLETWLSGPALARDHASRQAGPARMTPPEIVAAAGAGDALAQTSLTLYVGRLARGLAHVVNLLDPQAIVLGGGLSNIPGLTEELTQRMEEWVFSDRLATRILTHLHGDSSGVRGAAWLWPAT